MAMRDEFVQRHGSAALGEFLKKWIKIAAFFIGSFFTFLQISNAPLNEITKTLDNTSLIKIGLVIYFFGWLYGANHDTEIQTKAYVLDPGLGRLGFEEVGGIILFLAVFAGMYYLHDQPIVFQVALLIFICTNMYTWRVIFNRTIVMINATAEKFSSGTNPDLFSLAKLNIVVNYMNGRWQKARFFTLIGLCVLQLILAMAIELQVVPQFRRGMQLGGVELSTLIGYSPGIFFIIYVFIAEVWMKVYRIRAFSDIETIDYLQSYFTMKQREKGVLPAIDTGGVFDKMLHSHPNYRYNGPFAWFVDPQ